MRISKKSRYVLAVVLASVSLAARADEAKPTGILVNGTEITQWGSGSGWEYHEDTGVLHLHGGPDNGPYTISGTNTDSRVHIHQTGDATVILKNLHLETTLADSPYAKIPPFLVGEKEVQPGERYSCVSKIILEGENEIVAKLDDDYYTAHKSENLMTAAIQILHGSTVEINETLYSSNKRSGKLTVRGAHYGAAIGGGKGYSTGKIVINGGTVDAYGGFEAAGIGGGYYIGTEDELPGEIVINGGFVSAIGSFGQEGGVVPAIGASLNHRYGYGYKIQINGGTVHAYGAQGKTFRDIASKNHYFPAPQPLGYPVTITGGNIDATILDARDEDGRPLHKVTVTDVEDVRYYYITPPKPGYNIDDIRPIENKLHFWLPNGYYSFKVNDKFYRASVDEADTTAFKGAAITKIDVREQWPWNGKVDITCEVEGDLIQEAYTNGWIATTKVTAQDEKTGEVYEAKTLSGDLTLATGKNVITWDLTADGIDPDEHDYGFRFSVVCDVKPAACMIVDISGGPSATNFPVTYLDHIIDREEFLGKHWYPDRPFYMDSYPTLEYRREKIVLNRIHPGTFRLGGPNKDDPNEPYEVTLTKPYFLGVFEMTQGQIATLRGNDPYFRRHATLPCHYIHTPRVRGAFEGGNWPDSRAIDEEENVGNKDSHLCFLRHRTGLLFDLPTSAQWEYAARAGATTAYYWGDDFAAHGDYAWCNQPVDRDDGEKRAPCGVLKPNAWGLYDMIGNVKELCLDRVQGNVLTEASYGVNPVGPKIADAGGDYRVYRGGYFNSPAEECTLYYRSNSDFQRPFQGFRLALPLEVADFTGALASNRTGQVRIVTAPTLAIDRWAWFNNEVWWRNGLMPTNGQDIVIRLLQNGGEIIVGRDAEIGKMTVIGDGPLSLKLTNGVTFACRGFVGEKAFTKVEGEGNLVLDDGTFTVGTADGCTFAEDVVYNLGTNATLKLASPNCTGMFTLSLKDGATVDWGEGTLTMSGDPSVNRIRILSGTLDKSTHSHPFGCVVNLMGTDAIVKSPSEAGWMNVVSSEFPGGVQYLTHDGIWTFYVTNSVDPKGSRDVHAATAEEAMEKVEITISDKAAAAAGQADVVKKVAVPDTTYGEGYWKVSLAIDEEKMPEGKKLADSVAAFVSSKTGMTALAGATETKTITIPSASLTSGLYYSLLVSSNVNLANPTETPRALADGRNDLSLTVAPAAEPAAPRFFKIKVSLQKESF